MYIKRERERERETEREITIHKSVKSLNQWSYPPKKKKKPQSQSQQYKLLIGSASKNVGNL